MNQEQLTKIQTEDGFIAALDQSGGSTPGALTRYGIEDGAYSSDAEMFDLIHQMRTRIITSPAFTGERILAASNTAHLHPNLVSHAPAPSARASTGASPAVPDRMP